MIIIYDSLTGMGKKFAESLGYNTIDINDFMLEPKEDLFFLVTRCFGFGEIPIETIKFLRKYYKSVIGVACGGNKNWGENFAVAGEKIEQIYGIKSIVKFEGSGFEHERETARIFLDKFMESENGRKR